MPEPALHNLSDDPAHLALFLDVDGTLLPLAATPAEVSADAQTSALLKHLDVLLDGALALVSGRSLAEIDRLFAPNHFAAAGQHGAEWRSTNGTVGQHTAHLEELEELRPRLRALAAADPRLLLEDKGLSLALHYRGAPARAGELTATLEAALNGYPALALQRGKYVLEIRATGCGKDTAIRRLLDSDVFAGRVPIFAGDDATDENGFRFINALGGVSIKVGAGASNAVYRLDDPAELFHWLSLLAEPTVQVTVQR